MSENSVFAQAIYMYSYSIKHIPGSKLRLLGKSVVVVVVLAQRTTGWYRLASHCYYCQLLDCCVIVDQRKQLLLGVH